MVLKCKKLHVHFSRRKGTITALIITWQYIGSPEKNGDNHHKVVIQSVFALRENERWYKSEMLN